MRGFFFAVTGGAELGKKKAGAKGPRWNIQIKERQLVAVVLGFERSLNRHPDVISLVFFEFSKFCA